MLDKIKKWACMDTVTTFDIGVFRVSASHPSNWVGWLAMTVEITVVAVAIKYIAITFF